MLSAYKVLQHAALLLSQTKHQDAILLGQFQNAIQFACNKDSIYKKQQPTKARGGSDPCIGQLSVASFAKQATGVDAVTFDSYFVSEAEQAKLQAIEKRIKDLNSGGSVAVVETPLTFKNRFPWVKVLLGAGVLWLLVRRK